MFARFIEIALIAFDWRERGSVSSAASHLFVVFFLHAWARKHTFLHHFSRFPFLCSFDLLFLCMPCHAISQPIRSIFIDTGNIIDFLPCYLYTFDVCKHNRMDVCVSFCRCLLLCAPSFISFIRFNLGWMRDTWKMKNDYVYRISFDDTCLTPFSSLRAFRFTHHIL